MKTLRLLALLFFTSNALAQDAKQLAPWLELPDSWNRSVQEGTVAAVPKTLAKGATLLFLVEPIKSEAGALDADSEQALKDLGPWKPVGAPTTQPSGNGWSFRFGVGVVTLEGKKHTALTAVARNGKQRARFWALADSDATYNKFQGDVLNAVSSVQDATAKAPATATQGATAPPAASSPAAAASKGVPGVYVGLERGMSTSAGGNAIVDGQEVDVFYADGTYRRGLPVRGMASDLNWEKSQQAIRWGTWARDGNVVLAGRQGYVVKYTVQGNDLLSDRGRTWYKITPPANRHLNGSYARADYRDASAPRLVLRADGSYEDRNDFLRMVGGAWHLVTPDGDAMLSRWSDAQARAALGASSGTYDYANFSLTLRSNDGRVWQINAYIPPGDDAVAPRGLVINGRLTLRD